MTDGTVQLHFNADDVSGTQALISRDAYRQDEAGHLTIYLSGDNLVVRLQSETESYTITASDVVTPGTSHQMAFSFGAGGMELYLDGDLVGTNSYTGGIEGNDEPWAIGANAWRSDTGTNSSLRHFFQGEIAEVAIFDSQLSSADIGELYTAGLDPLPLISGTEGNDTLDGTIVSEQIEGAAGDDAIAGAAGDHRLFGGAGNDTQDGGIGADQLDGGDGVDTATYTESDLGVTVDLAAGTGSGGLADGDTLTNIENVTGSDYADTLTGDETDNLLIGLGGDDTLTGSGGDDNLVGGDGNNTLSGGTGNDELSGGAGDDILEGGDGSDYLNSGDGADILAGSAGNDYLKGGAGADSLDGGDGVDKAYYTSSAEGVNVNLETGIGSGG